MDINNQPVTTLEGIGPATRNQLQQYNIYTVADLVRVEAGYLVAATRGRVSLNTAGRWRAMALLMGINGADHQLAEALVAEGMFSTEQVRQRSVSELLGVFTAARDAGIIPSVPDATTVHGILLDATVLDLTASLNLTVLDPDEQPVPGAGVEIDGQHGVTDTNGRIRMVRITLGQPQQLVVTHDAYDSLIVDNPPLVSDDAIIASEHYTLGLDVDTEAPDYVGRLCEYQGDQLPPLAHHAMSTRAMGGADHLRTGDVLVLHRFYSAADEVQLSSKFLQYENGRFYTLNWRVSVDRLPADAALKEVFRYSGAEFHPVTLSPHRLRHHLALRRSRNALAGAPAPVTPIEVDSMVSRFSDELLRQLGDGGDL